jgi:carbonyl reductase 1
VTGANKGIGFWIVKKLVEQSSSDETVILLGSRDLKRGQDALNKLGSPVNVYLLRLDTSSLESIVQAIDEIKQKHGGQLDVIINNAGISMKELSVDAVRQTFTTNYYGIKLLNEHLMPFLRENGRIINVSSQVGPMTLYGTSKDIQEKYTSPTLTSVELDGLVEDFITAIETNTLDARGYHIKSSSLIYGMSKAALNALTQVEMRQWSSLKNFLIVSVTPGFCATDINNNASDARSAELGANSILHAVNSDRSQLQNGAFYRDGKQLPFISEPIPRNQWKNSYEKLNDK